MKKALIYICLSILVFGSLMLSFSPQVSYAENIDVEVLSSTDDRLKNNYLDFYSIPTKFFTYSNNGGEISGNELAKAFDRDFNTSFKSSQDNNIDYQDENGETQKNFINTVDITFSEQVKLDRIMYGAESGTDRGYPINLNIYMSTDGNNFSLVKAFSSTATANMVIFNLGTEINAKAVRFEYVDVNKNHKYVATAREIIFLQKETGAYEQYSNLFSNYSQTNLSQEYSNLVNLENLESIINSSLEYVSSEITQTFARAKDILNGTVNFDESREFSTNPNANNVIKQNGDITSYARGTLRMWAFGTNRQVTGISAKEGEVITVYVEAEEGQPLPELYFSQTENYYNGWLASKKLSIGKNTFVTPNLKNDGYSREVVTGGALYISNPYTKNEQSQNINIYIEGGDTFPIFFMGGDESQYKQELSEYYAKLIADPDNNFDITELVSDHIILTVTAINAYDYYINKSYSPQSALLGWDEYMELLLDFGGITFDKTSDMYKPIHEFLNTNIRIVQNYPGGAAYAFYEHVGIYRSWESTALIGGGFGWGYSHELGHMFDIPERTVSECSNNMWSKYYETAIAKLSTRGDFDQTLEALSGPDDKTTDNYFNTNRLNYLVWWYLETYHNGFWGELENCYRGLNKTLLKFYALDSSYKTKVNSLNATEKQVFYSSLVAGIDLSYYFERWGYNLSSSDEIFKYNQASDTFKELMQIAVNKKYVSNTKKPKLWLQDKSQYNILQESNKALYSGKEKVSINKVLKGTNGYSVILNEVTDARFLGYEILRTNESGVFEIIAFTQDGTYFDTETLSYTPSYKVKAYDRLYNTSALSASKTYSQVLQNVCRIGDTYFMSLSEAIANASENDEIILLTSFTTQNLVVDKNLTIRLADGASKSITIYRAESGDLITINSGITLTLIGNEKAHIILDGNTFKQNGSLVCVGGVLNSNYVDFQNNYSKTIGGGAIRVITNNKGFVSTISNGSISNNTSISGGAINTDYANNVIILNNIKFSSNTSLEDGGAIKNKGTITINSCNFVSNTAVRNGCIYNYSGGIAVLNDCLIYQNTSKAGGGVWIDGYTEINRGKIYNNSAETGGGIGYFATSVATRKLIINQVEIKNNFAQVGAQIYSTGVNLQLTAVTAIGDINLSSGNCTIADDCILSSTLELGSVNLTFKNGLFEGINNCILSMPNAVQGSTAFRVENFDLTQNVLDQIDIKQDHIKLNIAEDVAIVEFIPLTVTLIDKGKVIDTITINYGETLTLPNLDSKDFLGWKNGNEFVDGQEIVVVSNLTLTAGYKSYDYILKIIALVFMAVVLFVVNPILYIMGKKKNKQLVKK